MRKELPLIALAALGAGLFFALSSSAQASARGDTGDPNAPGPAPDTNADPSVNMDNPNALPPDQLEPSPELLDFLKAWEGTVLLTKTDLGDGGYTIGWGHFEPTGSSAAAAMPDTITPEQADMIFAQDVETRAVLNVRRYVFVPLLQQQFDALTSLAFNLSPASFSTIAEQVNAGNSIDPVAYNYVRAGTQFETGLRRRRDAEVAMWASATYTA